MIQAYARVTPIFRENYNQGSFIQGEKMTKFILSAFGDEISPHLDEQIRVLLANDIHYLEFRGMEGKGIIDYPLTEVKNAFQKLTQAGVAVSAVGSPIGKIPVTDAFAPHLERFKKTIDVAHTLHTTFIRMFRV